MHSIDDARATLLDQDAPELYRPGRVSQQPDMGGIRSFVAQMEPGHAARRPEC